MFRSCTNYTYIRILGRLNSSHNVPKFTLPRSCQREALSPHFFTALEPILSATQMKSRSRRWMSHTTTVPASILQIHLHLIEMQRHKIKQTVWLLIDSLLHACGLVCSASRYTHTLYLTFTLWLTAFYHTYLIFIGYRQIKWPIAPVKIKT